MSEKKKAAALDERTLENVSGGLKYEQPGLRFLYVCPACGYMKTSAQPVPCPQCGATMELA